MAAKAVAPDGSWLTPGEAGAQLRLSPITIGRMFADEDIPGFRARSAIRIPAAFVADFLDIVRSGGQVNIRDFGRQWKAQQEVAS
ncbi:MAG: hypothetical protein ACLQDY_08640, partial [Streptosporangiaceae bacterium]|jgi:hypothetical protein